MDERTILARQNSLLEAALQALPVGIVVHDKLGRCILANAAAYAIGSESLEALTAAVHPETMVTEEFGGRTLEAKACTITTELQSYTLTSIADVTRHHAVQRDLIAQAFIDALTGLPSGLEGD